MIFGGHRVFLHTNKCRKERRGKQRKFKNIIACLRRGWWQWREGEGGGGGHEVRGVWEEILEVHLLLGELQQLQLGVLGLPHTQDHRGLLEMAEQVNIHNVKDSLLINCKADGDDECSETGVEIKILVFSYLEDFFGFLTTL